MTQQVSQSLESDTSVTVPVQQKTSVWEDLLQGKETQQVQEFRDEYYRILKKSEEYHTDVRFVDTGDEETSYFEGRTTRRASNMLSSAPEWVFKNDGDKITYVFDIVSGATLQESMHVNPKIEYNVDMKYDFLPKFDIRAYLIHIIERVLPDGRFYLDLYLRAEAGQFDKISPQFIAEMMKVIQNKQYKSQLFEMDKIGFITDVTTRGVEPMRYYEYEDIDVAGIYSVDGCFVVSLVCKKTKDGEDVTEKYRKKEVDKKYENKESKNLTAHPDIFEYKTDSGQELINFETRNFN